MGPRADSVTTGVDGDRVQPPITVHDTSPMRVGVTERGGSDGWIAIDVTTEIVE